MKCVFQVKTIFLWSRPISGWQQQTAASTTKECYMCTKDTALTGPSRDGTAPGWVLIEPAAPRAPENFVDHAFFLSDHALLCAGKGA